jgi:hypothetical protein
MKFRHLRILYGKMADTPYAYRNVRIVFSVCFVFHRKDERRMNAAAPFEDYIFGAGTGDALSHPLVALRCGAPTTPLREIRDEHSRQTVLRRRARRLCLFRGYARAGADDARMQTQLSGGQGGRPAETRRWAFKNASRAKVTRMREAAGLFFPALGLDGALFDRGQVAIDER